MINEKEALLLLLYSVAVGAFLGMVYDFFRIMRIAFYGRKKPLKELNIPLSGDKKVLKRALSVSHSQIFPSPAFFVVFLCDIMFWLFAGLIVTVMLFQFGDGKVRAFALMGAFFGFVLYYFTVGKLVMVFSDTIISAVKLAVRTVLRFTVLPIVKAILHIVKRVSGRFEQKRRVKKTQKYIKSSLGSFSKCGKIRQDR